MSKPHYNVLIATPGRLLHNAYVKSLIETTNWLNEQGLTYKFINAASSFVPQAREMTALDEQESNWETNAVGAGKYTYDKIFWIDSDISWSLEAFKKIYESEHDIVSGLYYTSVIDMTVSASGFGPNGYPFTYKELDFFMVDEPIEVFGVGFGFVAMKYGVFELMPRPWFQIQRVDWVEKRVVLDIGEDYSWCISARKCGFKIMLDSSVKVSHHKESEWYLR